MWQAHKIGNIYHIVHANGKKEDGWKIAYYPLFGAWDNSFDKQGNTTEERWVDFDEPRALIEKPTKQGIDFREVPL